MAQGYVRWVRRFESTDSEARYDIEVKFTNDWFKPTNLELAEEDNDEGNAASPSAKKAKKTAAGNRRH